tara:strand:- start:2366 stop:2827 length:462 start_codon:yes stop_codon:yes gene_type:complete
METIKKQIKNYKGDKRSKEYKDLKAELKASNYSYEVEPLRTPKIQNEIPQEAPKEVLVKSGSNNPFEDLNVLEELKTNRRHYRNIKSFSREQYDILTANLPIGNQITGPEQNKLLEVYNQLFGTKKKRSNCASCVRSVIKMLQPLVGHYKALL